MFELACGAKISSYQDNLISSEELRQLFGKLLNADPEVRFAGGWEDIKKQKFFHDIEWEDPGKINTAAL